MANHSVSSENRLLEEKIRRNIGLCWSAFSSKKEEKIVFNWEWTYNIVEFVQFDDFCVSCLLGELSWDYRPTCSNINLWKTHITNNGNETWPLPIISFCFVNVNHKRYNGVYLVFGSNYVRLIRRSHTILIVCIVCYFVKTRFLTSIIDEWQWVEDVRFSNQTPSNYELSI